MRRPCKVIVDASAGPVERERKYLLASFPEHARGAPVEEIDQGWLPGERLRERLRRVRDGAGERFYRTIKLGAGERRIELEETTTAELFAALWPHTAGCRVQKRRYRVRDGDLVWEIDEFIDRELWLAEVELPDERTASVPAWLQPCVVRDVTGEGGFTNLELAR